MDYKNYTVEDFVLDKHFREWVLSENAESNEFWNQWIAKNPNRLSVVMEARTIVRNMQFREYSLSRVEKDLLWKDVERETSKPVRDDIPIRYLSVDRYRRDLRNRKPRWSTYAVAASIIICLAISSYFLLMPNGGGQLVYRTGFGQTRDVTLSDGSTVVLNSNSMISLRRHWDADGAREVHLEGEAFFDVVSTGSRQPFVVHADQMDVHVLGTRFNVYARDRKASVELASGKLKVADRTTGAAVELEPGDQVVYEEGLSAPVKRAIDADEVGAWKDNLLIFRRTSLEEIASLLRTNYELEVFFVDPSIANQYFTGTAPADDVDMLLMTLSRTFGLEIERNQNIVLVRADD